MSVYIPFGECLKRILCILDISINRLAKAINVDNSLVNRWVNGKRIPAYNTPYIDSITDFVARNIRNSFQVQQIDELYAEICNLYDSEYPIKDKIRILLQEAQGYSIEHRKREKARNKENSGICHRIRTEITGKEKAIFDLSSEDKIIIGTENILSAVADLLTAVSELPPENKSSIYIDYNCDSDLPDYLEKVMARCVAILSEIIHNGWKVYLVVKLGSNTANTIKLIKFTLPLLTRGRFFPYYKKTYDKYPNRQSIIIPGIGAVTCLLTGPDRENSSAFLFRTQTAIDIFEKHFNEQLSAISRPLFRYFDPDDFLGFNHYFAEFEDNIGNRYLFKNGFTDLMLTEKVYKKLLSGINISNDEFLASEEFFRKRFNGFLTNIVNYQYYDICLSDSVKELIKNRQVRFYSCKGVETIDMEVCDIAEYLRNVITLLETYDKYNIALIPKKAYFIRDICNFTFMVKERQAVVVMVNEPPDGMKATILYTEEPTVVNAVYNYFKDTWEHIAPVHKDKREIIKWLQNQLSLMESQF